MDSWQCNEKWVNCITLQHLQLLDDTSKSIVAQIWLNDLSSLPHPMLDFKVNHSHTDHQLLCF